MTQDILTQAVSSLFQSIQAESDALEYSETSKLLKENKQLSQFTDNLGILLVINGPSLIIHTIRVALLTGFQLGQLAQKQESEIEALEKML